MTGSRWLCDGRGMWRYRKMGNGGIGICVGVVDFDGMFMVLC